MINPEFRRNLWLSFSPHRLIAMPGLLALSFLAFALSGQNEHVAQRLYNLGTALFIFIVWLWGARNANAAIVDEIRDKTWDQQRMSALSPWEMTWGKLLGATSFNWYGGTMCLVVVAVTGVQANKPDLVATLLSLCATGILIHAALLALNLHSAQFESRFVQRGGMGWLAIILVFMLTPWLARDSNTAVEWWGMQVPRALFLLDTSLLFAACATFAAWRVACNALQVRTRPWAWPAFAILLALYLAGFAHEEGRQPLWVVGLFVATAMTYAALFTEQNSLLRWRKLRLLQQRGDWRGWLEQLPMWPGTLVLSLLFDLMILLTAPEQPVWQGRFDPLPPQQALTIALMLARDACILLFFSFARDNKRAAGTAMLYLIVLDMLLPFLAGVAGLDSLRYFLLPFEAGHNPWSSTLVMTLHLSAALWVVNRRLRNDAQQ